MSKYLLYFNGVHPSKVVESKDEIQEYLQSANISVSSVEIYKFYDVAKPQWNFGGGRVEPAAIPQQLQPEPFELRQMSMRPASRKPANNNKQWSEVETNYAVNAMKEGINDEAIAEILQRSPGAVQKHLEPHRKLFKGGPSRRNKKWSKRENSQLIELFEEGYTRSEMASRLNRSVDGVRNRVNRLIDEGKIVIA